MAARVSSAAARRRMEAANYTQRTINSVLGGGGRTVNVQAATSGFGRGATNLGRVLRGEEPGRDK